MPDAAELLVALSALGATAVVCFGVVLREAQLRRMAATLNPSAGRSRRRRVSRLDPDEPQRS
jgi:hypothetical protein